MPATLLNGTEPPPNSFVLRRHKIVYVETTKVASSSLRWMIADLVGEDFERFYRAHGAHQSRFMTIHTNRDRWQHAPRLCDLRQDELAEISRHNGWFVFAVIRDPWTRLWSAWQSKFLVHHTPYLDAYGDQPWFPRDPTSPNEIVDDWAAFVDAKPWQTQDELKIDEHFMDQFSAVQPRGIDYTRIYDLTDMAALEADLHAHLQAIGRDKELYLPRANENAVPMATNTLDGGIDDVVSGCYATDIAEWGERWDLETIKLRLRPIGMDSVRAIRYQIETNARIGDLSKEVKRARQRASELEAETADARAAVAAATKPGAQSATPTRGPSGFAGLLQSYPWPSRPRYPAIAPVGRLTNGFELVVETIRALDTSHPVVLEIGAELGGSTRSILAVPNTHVVSVDPWKNGHEFRPWPELREFKGVDGAAFDLFASFNFQHRDRLVALRESSPRGLLIAYDAGLRPDVVYIDGDHRTGAVLRDLTVTAALFPDATLCGNDWKWQPQRAPAKYGGIAHPVRAAVRQWAEFQNHFIETRANTWLLDPSRPFDSDDRASTGRGRQRETVVGAAGSRHAIVRGDRS